MVQARVGPLKVRSSPMNLIYYIDMETLYTYIIEARARVNELPFTNQEWQHFCDCVFGCDYDNAKIYIDLQKRLIKKFGKGEGMKYFRLLIGYAEGYYYGDNADQLYDSIKNMPLKRLESLLGAGSYGTVLDLGHGKVLKWFHAHTLSDHSHKLTMKFFDWCLKNDYPYFPKVYKVTEKYVVMEKLDMQPEKKLKKYNTFLKTVVSYRDVINFVKGKAPKPKFHHSYKECWDWHVSVCKAMMSMGIDYPSDLHTSNLGIRPSTGEVVYFDPV